MAINSKMEERRREKEEFKLRLFKEFNVEENPKREKCFDLAWGFGHAYGFQEVENYFGDFVELIK